MADNWVEARYKREQNLLNADSLWQQAIVAVQNACKSFNKLYPRRKVEVETQNGHRLLVTITMTVSAQGAFGGMPVMRHVAIEFNDAKHAITVIVDDSSPTTFPIKSDESRCFITLGNEAISPDQFSQRALEKPLFDPLQVSDPAMRFAKAAGGPNSWME